MHDLNYYIPSELPSRFKLFDSKLKQMEVGKTGKKGLLQVKFQKDSSNKTKISDIYSEVPFCTQKALYCDSDSDLAYFYIVSVSGGILQGDRYRIDINLNKDSQAHITTQGATRVYSMNCNYATQMINITLDENAYLEFIPDQIIPYQSSRFYQMMSLKIHDSATLIYSEILASGRIGMDESFAYDVCYLKTKATNQDNKYRFLDIANIDPKNQKIDSFGILNNRQMFGTVYILTHSKHISELRDKINVILNNHQDVFGGVTIMMNDSGLLVRLLGDKTEHLKEVIFEILMVLRKKIINAPFSGVRKS